uniref:uncharacterized protein LOC129118292 n=1 Tax=Agelaius phoeniceus TaxID=39638 RepID=UPI0023EBE929|nr:uncharacterized protein LOC129118292 [Agelaius phoeniceus]
MERGQLAQGGGSSSDGDHACLLLFPQVQAEARKTCTAKRPPTVVRRPAAPSGGMAAVSHTLPKAGAGCLFNSLQRREQARAEQARLLTLRGIMGDSSLRPTPEECHGPSNTWPQKCGWRKGGPGAAAAGPQPGELLLYVRNPLVQDIDAECGAAPQKPCLPHPKITCPRVSLGSVLSLELPRDAVVLGCRRGTEARQQEAEGQEQRQDQGVLPGKMEFQMMEGTLERKHASCRAWGLFHAVLMRQTLCFYQDRRDSLKSSVVALPLNLSGAVCTPDAEYTKKTNCFRLQLQDGSEYLLRAPTQPLMNEWVSKLQQNSGFPKVDYFQAAAQHVEGTGGTGSFSKFSSPGASHLQGHHQVTSTKSQEMVVLPCASPLLQRSLGSQDGPVDGTVTAAENAQGAGHKEQQWPSRASPGLWDNICPEDDYGLVANKRRSYSFTSATYQKLSPRAVPQEAAGAGSSYSVTLYIGEQAVPRARCHSFVAPTGSPRDARGEKTTSPPRTKNKSVFKKFFGKKE